MRAPGGDIQIPFIRPAFDGYDGVVIGLKNNTALVPDGEVEHPFDALHGKRTTYQMGVEMREVTY